MIADAAGITGLDPRPMSLRSLLRAATARQRSEWDQTAQILWMLAEVNRNRKLQPKPYQIEDFHPLRQAEKKKRGSKRPKVSREAFLRFCAADLRKHGQPVPESLLKELGEYEPRQTTQ